MEYSLKREYQDRLEKLSDTNHELIENLKAAEDQNHYLKLAHEFRDKYYAALRTIEALGGNNE